jgi:hypothetical protein
MRPIGSISPKTSPYRATRRHGGKVCNDETMVECLPGGDTNAMIDGDDSIRCVETSANFAGTTYELRGAPSGRFVQLSMRRTALPSGCT